MRFQTLTIISSILALVAAQQVEQDDIPAACTSLCADVVATAQRCDLENDDNDAAELQCICTAPNSAELVPTCELCVRSNPIEADDINDNDVTEVLVGCGFQRAQ